MTLPRPSPARCARPARAVAVALALVSLGCGSSAPTPRPRGPRPGGRAVAPVPQGPAFDRGWVAAAPAEGFLYAAVDGADFQARLRALLPEGGDRVGPGGPIAGWLRALGDAAGGSPLFPGGAGLVVGAAPGPGAAEPALDFWIGAPPSPGLDAALAALRGGEPGAPLQAEGLAPLHVGQTDGLVLLATRPGWVAGKGGADPWFGVARARVASRAGAFAVLAPAAYFQGSIREVMARRSPAEYARTARLVGLLRDLTLELVPFDGGLRVEVRAPLEAGHPEAATLRSFFRVGAGAGEATGLDSILQVPEVTSLYLAARVDPAAGDALAGGAPTGSAKPPAPAPPSPFKGRDETGPGDPPDLATAVKAGVAWLRGAVREALADWAGPEVALALQWDARWPRLSLLLGNRSPKRAALAVQRFQSGEVGRKLRFVDEEAHGVPYGYTRLEGEDPARLEPAYGFLPGSLLVASHRDHLLEFLDPGVSRLEVAPAMGGVLSRLGRHLGAAGYVRTSLLRHLARLGGEGSPLGAALEHLQGLAERVEAVAGGVGLVPEEGLRAVVVVTAHPGDEPLPEGSPPRGR